MSTIPDSKFIATFQACSSIAEVVERLPGMTAEAVRSKAKRLRKKGLGLKKMKRVENEQLKELNALIKSVEGLIIASARETAREIASELRPEAST